MRVRVIELPEELRMQHSRIAVLKFKAGVADEALAKGKEHSRVYDR